MTAIHWLLVALFAPLVAAMLLPTLTAAVNAWQTRGDPFPRYVGGDWHPRTLPALEDTAPLPSATDTEAAIAAMWAGMAEYGIERPA